MNTNLRKLYGLRTKYLADLKKIEDRDSIGHLRHEYEEKVRKLVVNQKNLGVPQSVSDKLTALRERYQLDVEKIISDSDAYRTWDTYVRECVKVIDEFLARSSQQDGGDDEEIEDRKPTPQPATSPRPTVQVIQHDVEVEDEPAEPEPFKLQFSFDEDDEPPKPTKPRANYERDVADAWKQEVASPGRRTKQRSLANAAS